MSAMDSIWSDNVTPVPSHFAIAFFFAFGSFAARFLLDRFVFRRLAIRMLTRGKTPSRISKEMQAKIAKCSESMWKLTYYATVEAFIIKFTYREPWFSDTKLYFKDWPNHELKIPVVIYYMCGCGFYIYSIAAILTWETRRKDFSVMFTHHVITVLLIGTSYLTRYGEIFKTHILGCPCVMLASPEAARFVLVTHSHLFKPTYPKSKEKLIGPAALFFHQGDYHTRIRKLVQTSLSPDSIKKLIPGIENEVISSLDSWVSNGQVINTFQEMKKFSFNIGILSVFGHLESCYRDQLKDNYCIVEKGYNCFPTRIPGTSYSKAVLARQRIQEIISEIICKRREQKLMEKDLLGHLLNYKDEKGETLSDEQIADNVIGVLFAAQDTTASVLTWILKYLHDDKKLLEAIKTEQMALFEANGGGGKMPLTWGQTKNMPLTYMVILESLRMASIISFTFREAVVDVVYKGYLIPKGWKVMPLFRNIHHNPEFYTAPHNFDPSRFQVAPKPNTFMPFGNGVHSCPGNELAKLNMLILIHHLVTKFRWEVVGYQSGIQYSPFPIPLHGLQARFWRIQ